MADKKVGRPRLEFEPYRVLIRLHLHPGRDDDLIGFFEAIPEDEAVAHHVMAALRNGIQPPEEEEEKGLGDKLDDLMSMID